MSRKSLALSTLEPETRLAAAGRDYTEHGIVNPPVYHASTILSPTLEHWNDRTRPYQYGRRGTPTSRALEDAIAVLEDGALCRLCSSGKAAISSALLALLKAGDHLLMSDSVYRPARNFTQFTLARFGVETTFYDPMIGAGIKDLIRPNTRLVYMESPGSQTMEVQDTAAIAEAASKAGALVAFDNTWAAGHYFKPLQHGCDISIQAATKYIVGHSDAMLGTVTVTADIAEEFRLGWEDLGQCVGPDDIYLGLRGLRTLDVRLERHMKNALVVADWLRSRPEVDRVLYPALDDDPGHAIWKRDFTGASGLLSVMLKPVSDKAMAAMLDHMDLIHIGASWGGYESLALPFDVSGYRIDNRSPYEGTGLRLHIGLENPKDLIADLKSGFERMNRAG